MHLNQQNVECHLCDRRASQDGDSGKPWLEAGGASKQETPDLVCPALRSAQKINTAYDWKEWQNDRKSYFCNWHKFASFWSIVPSAGVNVRGRQPVWKGLRAVQQEYQKKIRSHRFAGGKSKGITSWMVINT